MSILKTLGDDWHAPHPFQKLIFSVNPDEKHVKEIESLLGAAYEAEHYGFKKYHSPVTGTIYDLDMDCWKAKIAKLQEDMKREEDSLEKLTKKFAELEGFANPHDQEDDEEEEEEEEEETPAPKEQGKQRVIANVKSGKQAQISAKEEAKRKAHQAKVTKSNMATSQQKLMDMQTEIATLEKRISYYEHYRYADLGHQRTCKRLMLAYEKDKDVKELIKGLSEMLDYYHMMRRRYIPQGPCSGTYKGLCDTHCLPLFPVAYSKDGQVTSSQCSLHPLPTQSV